MMMFRYLLISLSIIYCTQLQAQTSCITIQSCSADSLIICDNSSNFNYYWNENTWKDALFYDNDLREGLVDLGITAQSTCGSPLHIRYELLLDIDNDGKQETLINSDALPGYNAIRYNNLLDNGVLSAFDERPVPANRKYGFAQKNSINGNTVSANLRWNTPENPNLFVKPELPQGTHKIRWIVTDTLQNQAVCAFTFTVKDCKNPSLFCSGELTLNFTKNKALTLYASDFIQIVDDNSTPPYFITLALRKDGTGTGFPVDTNGNPIQSIQFNCSDLGPQLIEIWALDQAGNSDYCQSYLLLEDYQGFCGSTTTASVTLCAKKWCSNSPLNDLTFEVSGTGAGIPPFTLTYLTDPGNCATINSIPINANVTITAFKNGNPLSDNDKNGVDVLDVILISKHILGIQQLPAYGQIAADINKSNSISTFDLVELQKLLLGIYYEYPNNTSWSFVDSSFVFPNVNNPFEAGFPANYFLGFPSTDSTISLTFYGIKTGDVNCSANSDTSPNEDSLNQVVLAIQDVYVQAGTQINIPLFFKKSTNWLGFQFDLGINPDFLTLQNVLPQNDYNIALNNFGVSQNGVNFAWGQPLPKTIPEGASFTTLTVTAKQSGWLHDLITLNDFRLKPRGYLNTEEKVRLKLEFVNDLQNAPLQLGVFAQPNPTTSNTFIAVNLLQSESIQISLQDINGNIVWTNDQTLDAGLQNIEIPAAAFPKTGVYFWNLSVGKKYYEGKIVRW